MCARDRSFAHDRVRCFERARAFAVYVIAIAVHAYSVVLNFEIISAGDK